MEEIKCIIHPDRPGFNTLPLCQECLYICNRIKEEKYEDMKYTLLSEALKEDYLLEQRSVTKEAIKAAGTFAEDNKEIMGLYSKLEEYYEELENARSKEKLDSISVTIDNYEQVESILAERNNLMNCIEKERSKLLLMIAQYMIKENASNAMVWADHRRLSINFINLDTKIPYLKMKTPPEVKAFSSRRFIGGPSLVKINAYVYLLGGFTGKESLNTLFRMLIKDPYKKVIKLQSMKVSRHDIAVVELMGKYIYAITGSVFVNDREIHTRECEVYNIEKNTWARIHPVNVGAAASGSCTFNERYIFIYGGETSGPSRSSDTNRIESYDTLDDEHGWILHKISKSVVYFDSGTDKLMRQISTNEILIAHHKKLQIIELRQETIMKSKTFEYDNMRLDYSAIQLYKGKVFWTVRDKIHEYNIIKRAQSFTPIFP